MTLAPCSFPAGPNGATKASVSSGLCERRHAAPLDCSVNDNVAESSTGPALKPPAGPMAGRGRAGSARLPAVAEHIWSPRASVPGRRGRMDEWSRCIPARPREPRVAGAMNDARSGRLAAGRYGRNDSGYADDRTCSGRTPICRAGTIEARSEARLVALRSYAHQSGGRPYPRACIGALADQVAARHHRFGRTIFGVSERSVEIGESTARNRAATSLSGRHGRHLLPVTPSILPQRESPFSIPCLLNVPCSRPRRDRGRRAFPACPSAARIGEIVRSAKPSQPSALDGS